MSRIKRWLAGAASAALLMGSLAPASGHADDAVDTPTTHAGACAGVTGVTVVVDYQGLGGNPEVGCAIGDPTSGIGAVKEAGFTSVDYRGFVCQINGQPASQKCQRTPPASAYWSYWHSSDQGRTWSYANTGGGSYDPQPGEWEGWSFSLNATASTNPKPRTGLALAQYRNAESTTAAADWIADQWDADSDQFASGLADNILALGAAKAHPEIVTEMVEAMETTAGDYITGADSLAKVLIALDVAGQDTNHFLGCERDLTAELDKLVADNAKSLNSWWGPHMVTIALNRLGKPVPQNVFDLLMARQKEDGRFGYPDDTGLALSALIGVSENTNNPNSMRATADTAIAAIIAWSKDPANQKAVDGTYYWTSFSPANSTGILAGALAEAGADITSAQAFMQAQQKLTGVGAWSNTLDGTESNAMATTQGIFAVAGTSYGKASLEVPRKTPVCTAPKFTTQPASSTATVGGTVSFTVAADAYPTPTFTWELAVGGTWTTVNGQKDSTLTFANVTAAKDGVKIRAIATNALGSVTSRDATLNVTSATTTPRPPVSTPPTPPVSTPPSTPPAYAKTVYNTPGYHKVNGRHWFTTCEPYSSTQRCRTLIEATSVKEVNGTFVAANGWTFNNLTYLPSSKSVWKGNPLGHTGKWTTMDGREWKTECNTPQTGGNGCRSYTKSRVVSNLARPGEPVRYGWTTRWEFNNIVQFS